MLKKFCFIVLLLFNCLACKKEDKTFNLNTVQLNYYDAQDHTDELLFMKVLGTDNLAQLAISAKYPSNYTLPVRFKIHPVLPLKLYAQHYTIQLWGDTSGLIGTCEIDMDDYKIVFPIEMEVKSMNLGVSISGSWE